jgi:hypothetical protein
VHLLLRKPVRQLLLFAGLAWASVWLPAVARGQEPPPPPPPASAPQAAAPNANHGKVPPFLIIGTVFNENALAFPSVEVKIRRKGEKKFFANTYTNSRGEFAVRVPAGIEYEVVVHQKKYVEQSVVVDAKMEDVQKRLSIRLESSQPGKAGNSK